MERKNLAFFENIASERDHWKKKNRYYWADIEKLIAFLVPEHASVLEVGCGTGDLLDAIKAKKKVGVDFCRNMIDMAQKKYPDITFYVMEAESMRFQETFDFIILSNTIGYLEDIQQVLRELKKVCHPFTKVIVTYYNFLWQPLLNMAEALNMRMKQPEQNWLSQADINNVLYISGFEAFKSGERMLFPVNIPFVSHIFNKYLAGLPFLRKLCITNYVISKPFSPV